MKRNATAVVTRALLAAAVVLISLNAWMALQSLRQLTQSQYWVAHTWQVLYQIDNVIGSLRDAESSTRDFLITGRDSSLSPYHQAQQELPGEIKKLRNLTRDSPVEQLKITEIETVVNDRLDLLQEIIKARRSGATETQLLALSNSGETVMRLVRSAVSSMQQEENRLLAQRSGNSLNASRNAQATILVASCLDLLLVLVMFRYLAQEQRLREIADATSDRLEKLQTINDVALTQLTSRELTNELLARICKVIEADAAVLCMWLGDEVETHAVHGIELEIGQRIKLAKYGPIDRAVTTNGIVILSSSDHLTLPIAGFREEMHSIQVAPLNVSGRILGTIIAGRRSGKTFEERDKQLISLVADRIAISLDRAQAYEAELRARKLSEERSAEVRRLNTELEDRVRLRTAELEVTNKELEAFSYSVSHDLRAPLRTIDGFSLALEEDYRQKLDDTGRDYLRRIRNGVQRMGLLIDALLQLSRITRAEIIRETVNLSELAHEISADLITQTPNRQIHFTIEPDLYAIGDVRLLRVALENLFGNAVKFTSNVPTAEIQFGQEKQSGEFYVRDNGAGFDMQYANKLFTAFQRLHGDREFKGSGIGLATVARVVRRHHGNISAEGAVGRGAIFRFTLR
jgi:signal transduction histidine kinase/CHASE3 domain sensor protein